MKTRAALAERAEELGFDGPEELIRYWIAFAPRRLSVSDRIRAIVFLHGPIDVEGIRERLARQGVHSPPKIVAPLVCRAVSNGHIRRAGVGLFEASESPATVERSLGGKHDGHRDRTFVRSE